MLNTLKSYRQPINKKATFQPSMNQVKITLPDLPQTIIVNTNKKEIIPENIIVKQTIKETVLDVNIILNFVDVDKLLDVKQSKNVQVYELYQLKDLAKKLNIKFSNVNKKTLIEKIKELYNQYFKDQNNLIGELKTLPKINITLINNLFDIYHLPYDTKNKLIDKIKPILKTQNEPLSSIIKVLESEWVVPKK
jgi:hypothetical protein